MLRYSKLSVSDEIENALSYYHATFLRQIPRLYPRSEEHCPATTAPFFRAWATGSAATATATPTSPPPRCAMALKRQSEVALRHYLTEVHLLGAELSISRR